MHWMPPSNPREGMGCFVPPALFVLLQRQVHPTPLLPPPELAALLGSQGCTENEHKPGTSSSLLLWWQEESHTPTVTLAPGEIKKLRPCYVVADSEIQLMGGGPIFKVQSAWGIKFQVSLRAEELLYLSDFRPIVLGLPGTRILICCWWKLKVVQSFCFKIYSTSRSRLRL